MSHQAKQPLTFLSLYESPVVGIYDYQCSTGRCGPAAEEYSDSNHIVLMRHGAFCRHFGRKSVTADVSQSVFFAKGSCYSVSHPSDCGDRGTIFALDQIVLEDMMRDLSPYAADEAIPFTSGPCSPDAFWRHRQLVQALEKAATEPVAPLWVEEGAMRLMATILEAAFEYHSVDRKNYRDSTKELHAEHVECAKTYLVSHLNKDVSLEAIARASHTSPFHLSRLFQKATGISIHRYLTVLRLRASLERLAESSENLTNIAMDFGFSSHSHFTSSFQREFGCTPSDVRRSARGKLISEMSKNLTV